MTLAAVYFVDRQGGRVDIVEQCSELKMADKPGMSNIFLIVDIEDSYAYFSLLTETTVGVPMATTLISTGLLMEGKVGRRYLLKITALILMVFNLSSLSTKMLVGPVDFWEVTLLKQKMAAAPGSSRRV